MKQSFIQTKMIAVAMLLLSACGQKEEYVPKEDSEIPKQGIEIIVSAADFVTDGAPDTRATDNGKETAFENGDRIGIIILDENDDPIYDNIPYVYNNGKWTFDSGYDDGKGECYYDTESTTYIVYYPYNRAADGVASVDNLKAKFVPKFNQSDIKNYRSSDLMVWSSKYHLTSSEKVLNAELTHAFASFYLTPTVNGVILDDGNSTPYTGSYASEVSDISNISDVSLTIDNAVYAPFQATDGSLRCIVPTDISLGNIRCFYTISSKTYSNTINISDKVVANTRYACEPEIKDLTYNLSNAHVGDFYCKRSGDDNGYLIPGDVDLTALPKNTCVGIVFWVGSKAFEEDPLLKSNHPNCTHGLVVALKDAGSAMNWSEQGESIQNRWVNIAGNPYNNVVNLEEAKKMCGYSNTLALKMYNTRPDIGELRVLPYDAILEYSMSNLAPINSSGWYFPSIMELKFVCWGQGQSKGTVGRDYLNTQIGKVSSGSQFDSDNYWSSTEDSYEGWYRSYTAWNVDFVNGYIYVDDSYKAGYTYRVRPLLAF